MKIDLTHEDGSAETITVAPSPYPLTRDTITLDHGLIFRRWSVVRVIGDGGWGDKGEADYLCLCSERDVDSYIDTYYYEPQRAVYDAPIVLLTAQDLADVDSIAVDGVVRWSADQTGSLVPVNSKAFIAASDDIDGGSPLAEIGTGTSFSPYLGHSNSYDNGRGDMNNYGPVL